MNQEELISLIISKIEKLGIDYRPAVYDNQRAWIDTTLCIGGYNSEIATAYDHAHEYVHALYGDNIRKCEYDTLSNAEKRANREAKLLLWELFTNNGGSHDDIPIFCEVTGCPFDSTFSLLKKLNTDHIDMSLKECAVDYISYFDVIMEDTINVYNFLDSYDISHTDYYNALEALREVCGFDWAS